jgi:hypothetical protein
MPRVSLAFFATGCLFVLVGMSMGMWMGANQQFTLSPVHAHINLIGWATMGLMGTFYALAGERAPRRLAWANYGLLTLGVLIMAPALGSMLLGSTKFLPFLLVSEVLIVGGTLCFLASIVTVWMRSTSPARPASGVAATMPAE